MKRLITAASLALALAGCDPHTPTQQLSAAPMYLLPIAPERLVGTWYEVATFPGPFQDGCTQTSATYANRGDGTLGLTNRCVRNGREVRISGVATPNGPGKFKVRLQGVPFAGDYWVIGASRDGRTLLVGTPTRIAGWVLHRDRVFTPEQRRWAREVFRKNGYDEAAMQRTPQ
ncbi:lipocalin family protein [Pseudotabrizicola sp. L79]|uniref:lipocalin family protein n=1 Tax=Pseudotabrizicola sp. L79 TaxID=3118402 RepID=UPI002F95E328